MNRDHRRPNSSFRGDSLPFRVEIDSTRLENTSINQNANESLTYFYTRYYLSLPLFFTSSCVFFPSSSLPPFRRIVGKLRFKFATRGNRLQFVKNETSRRSWRNARNQGEAKFSVQLCESGSFRRTSLISGFEQLCPSTRLNPCNSSSLQQSKLAHRDPLLLFRISNAEIKIKFRVSSFLFELSRSKFKNVPCLVLSSSPFFHEYRERFVREFKVQPGHREREEQPRDPYAPYKILNLPSCFRYLPKTDYPWKSEWLIRELNGS